MRTLLLLLTVSTMACATERSRDDACPTWQGDVAPALAACTSCHGGASPAGNYALTSYLGALGKGSDDIANAIAGDAGSRLVTAIDPAQVAPGDEAHAGQGELHALLARWAGSCDLAYLDSSIHPAGILDPASAHFHGAEVSARGWDLGLCASCHGADFSGAGAPSCTTCHSRGPTACDTCHEAEPTTGAHTAHVGAGSANVACATCHRVPTKWDDEGHIRRDGAADPPPAEVELTGLAAVTVDPADRAGPPVFDAGTCKNVYCHGDVLGATAGGSARQPSWASNPPGPAPCGSCHGAPPPSHASAACATCHPTGATHLDGMTEVGFGGSGCSACHGSESSPAPPRDLAGNMFITAIGVGAHQAHLQVPSGLRPPIACTTCHVVPSSVLSPGHIDSTGPAEVVATLGWDRNTGTCATAWCHRDARPVWTETGGAACGTCHGVPPISASHTVGMSLTTCAGCHPATMDAIGRFIPGGAHLDGDVDVVAP